MITVVIACRLKFKISGDYEGDEAFKSSENVRDRERLQTVRKGDERAVSHRGNRDGAGRSATIVLRWANAYLRGGIALLLDRKRPPGKKASLGAHTVEEVTKGLKEGRWKRAKEIRVWLESDHEVDPKTRIKRLRVL